jgi:hypothetical protein
MDGWVTRTINTELSAISTTSARVMSSEFVPASIPVRVLPAAEAGFLTKLQEAKV